MAHEPRRFAPQWIALGVAVGAGLGVVFDNIAIGVGAGMALGVALAALIGRRG